MKVACVSTAGHQLVLNNIAPACGFQYFDDINYIGVAEFNPGVIYFGGWFVSEYSDWALHRSLLGDIPKVIIHWFGSDVLMAKRWMANGERRMFEELRSDRYCHIPPSDEIKEELENWLQLPVTDPLNVPAEKVRIPIAKPDKFMVGCYMPPSRQDFFRMSVIRDAIPLTRKTGIVFYNWLPPTQEIEYQATCQKRYALSPAEYDQVIADTSCLLRIPIHDAYSISAAEYLMSGRPVVSDRDLPHWPAWIKGKLTNKKVAAALTEARHDGDVPEDTVKFYQDMYDPALFKGRLEERCRQRWKGFRFAD